MKRSRTTIQQTLTRLNDFALCNDVFGHILVRTGKCIDAGRFTDAERVVALTWHADGVIGNGGFQYPFEGDLPGDPTYALTATAFKRIGCARAAQAFAEAFALFDDGKLPSDVEGRLDQYRAVSEAERERVDEAFWQANSELPVRLAAFIRAGKDEFFHLPDREG